MLAGWRLAGRSFSFMFQNMSLVKFAAMLCVLGIALSFVTCYRAGVDVEKLAEFTGEYFYDKDMAFDRIEGPQVELYLVIFSVSLTFSILELLFIATTVCYFLNYIRKGIKSIGIALLMASSNSFTILTVSVLISMMNMFMFKTVRFPPLESRSLMYFLFEMPLFFAGYLAMYFVTRFIAVIAAYEKVNLVRALRYMFELISEALLDVISGSTRVIIFLAIVIIPCMAAVFNKFIALPIISNAVIYTIAGISLGMLYIINFIFFSYAYHYVSEKRKMRSFETINLDQNIVNQ